MNTENTQKPNPAAASNLSPQLPSAAPTTAGTLATDAGEPQSHQKSLKSSS
ncbi:hypothetical protein CCACVL1_25647 [Corchorus capsularis]|uniref:Uncharacterized protein n=1 Tax=Corchorus capsularis TaxID=210143 RepID=A0A1R3GIP5_COCAP|nr:hypothetical protein CCACVL1_25647 [Corchorus capsularis]